MEPKLLASSTIPFQDDSSHEGVWLGSAYRLVLSQTLSSFFVVLSYLAALESYSPPVGCGKSTTAGEESRPISDRAPPTTGPVLGVGFAVALCSFLAYVGGW